MRNAAVTRETNETKVTLTLNIDEETKAAIDTSVGFFNHMLELFARRAHFGLQVHCKGDTDVDAHHSVEDTGIALGRAFDEALGERIGIRRYASIILPMDEALVMASVDISGRAFLSYDADATAEKVGDFDTELAEEFFTAFIREAKITLHIKLISGKNSHHILEAVFKAAGLVFGEAAQIDPLRANVVPSTKGTII
ncbi:imidazoleglycerol-phosphate dehydratase [Clostridia bacterium]|nr:imidazoleglycerol-phosphate dehydratase [Clostridia bacterium]